MKTETHSTSGRSPRQDTSRGAGVPAWVLPLYLVGLTLVFVGERVLSPWPSARAMTSLLGVVVVLFATAARFVPAWRAGGQRAQVERWLAVSSLAGVVALLIYAVTTPWGQQHLHLLPTERVAAKRVTDLLTSVWVSVLVISLLPMIFAETALYPMRDAEVIESDRVKSAMSAGLTLAMALVSGTLLVYAARGLDWKADFSYFRTARPSESTVNIAKSLSSPVRVDGFFPDVNEVRTEVQGYLRDLHHRAPKIQFKLQDRLLHPKLARELHATDDGVLILSKGKTRQTLRIGTELNKARAALMDLDRNFQEKLLKLARDKRTAYLTVGHGELNEQRLGSKSHRDTASVVKLLLQRQNYRVRNLGLSEGLGSDIPTDADVVFILGPQEPFAPEELGALKRYVRRGGKVFMALDPDVQSQSARAPKPANATASSSSASPATSSHPSDSKAPRVEASRAAFLDELAATVGITFTPVPLANERRHLRRRFNHSDRRFMATNSFSSHASVSTLSRNASRAAVVFDGAGYLTRRPGSKAKVDFAVRSLPGTFADKDLDNELDPTSEHTKVYYLAAAVTGLDDAKEEKKKTDAPGERAFVFADANSFGDVILSRSLTNQVLLVDALRWLVGEESFAGQVNSEKDVHLERTNKGDRVWFYSTIFGVPLLVALAGVWLSRRSRRAKGGEA